MPREANPDRPLYAQLIAEGRKKRQLSQLQLGQLIGRDAASIKKYEGGKVVPPFFVLMKIADVLNLNRSYLAKLVIQSESSDAWLNAACEEIFWVFDIIDEVGISLSDKPNEVVFYWDTREKVYDKMNFLLEVSDILQQAQIEYNKIVASNTNRFVKDLFRNKDMWE